MTRITPHHTGKYRYASAPWVEAMRLRTLPVSVSGVLMAVSLALLHHTFKWLPSVLCLLFAIIAQVASNFANEYFDFRAGFDHKGRVGPRRGVTEGDITPQAMRNATLATLAAAAAIGCTLTYWSGWWLIPIGILIVLGALAYSAGPYPLSHHGLGEVAVVVFFGIAPVTLTYRLQAGAIALPPEVWMAAVATGLLGANVLLVNNYRDCDDDAAVGKQTLAVRFGRGFASTLYLVNGIVAVILMHPVWQMMPPSLVHPLYLVAHFALWRKMRNNRGSALNPLLGQTAVLMLCYTLFTLLSAVLFN